MRARPPSIGELLTEVLAPCAAEALLFVGLEPPASLRAMPRASVGALPEAWHGGVVLGPTAEPLLTVLRDCAARVRPGGVLVVAVPIAQDGVRAVAQRALSTFDPAKRPRPLEEVCAALLSVGVSRVKVRMASGMRGEAVVHGVLATRPGFAQPSPA